MNNENLPVKDSYSYKGWLTSDKFIKRAMACLGYAFVAQMIIYVVLIAIFMVGVFLVSLAT